MDFNIQSTRIYSALILCSLSFLLIASERFEVQLLNTGWIQNETRVHLFDDTKRVGFLSYTKTPLLNRYIIHSFYITPKKRNRGYGTRLLLYTCNLLKERGAHMVYIQPGPFELVKGQPQKIQEAREVKIKKLVDLYKRAGFVPANKVTQRCASFLYTCIGIEEDSAYLLYKNLTN